MRRVKRIKKREFTYPLSGHLPLWARLNADIDDETLDPIINR